jgi:hypothetical protein
MGRKMLTRWMEETQEIVFSWVFAGVARTLQ